MSTSSRGFASMNKSKQREIARKGGKASGVSRSASSHSMPISSSNRGHGIDSRSATKHKK